MTTRKRTGGTRLTLAAGLLFAVGAVGMTAAAYTDEAVVNLGNGTANSGVGNPNRFDIAVFDASGTLQDAVARPEAVVLPLVSGTEFSEETPVVFTAEFVNRDPGITGDLTFALFDPDDQGATDVFHTLHYTITINGSPTPVIADATAAEVAAATIVVGAVAPGESVVVTVSAILPPGTSVASIGKSTQLGVEAKGETQ